MALRRRVSEFDALLLTSGIWFLAKFLRYAFPPLFSEFREAYHVTNALLGTAFTALMLCYAAMQFPSGALADRIGGGRVVVAGAGVTSVAALLLAVEVPLSLVFVGMGLVGVGTGVHKTVSVRLLSDVYPERTGRVLGVFDTFGTAGGIAAPAAVVLVSGTVGWRAAFLAGGALGLALAAATFVRVEDGGSRESAGRGSVRAYAGVFADRRVATFVGVTVLFSFAYNGVVAFLPLYLQDAAGTTDTLASVLYGLVFAVSVVQPVSGELADRFGSLRVMAGSILLATAGLGLLLVVRSTPGLAVAVAMLGVGSHGYRPVRGAHLMRLLPDSTAGGGLGVVRTILMVAGAVSPAVVGYLSAASTFGVAFGLLTASLGLALAGVLALAVRDAPS